MPGGHMAGTLAYTSHSTDEIVSLVDKIAAGKPDLIKLMITGGTLDIEKIGDEERVLMPPEQVKAACDEAHRLGYRVAAHVQGAPGMRVAVENGVDIVEHGGDMDDALIAQFKEKGAALTSTITVVAAMACLPLELSGLSQLYRDSCRALLRETIAGFQKAVAVGIPVGLGLDNGSPLITHYCTWRELDFFTRYIGTPPAYALHAATQVNAELAGLGGMVGTIEPGKLADFLIAEGDPLQSFAVLAKPYMVVKEGKIYKKPRVRRFAKYDALLDRVKEFDAEFLS